MSYTLVYTVPLGAGKTGLTLQYRLYNTSGSYIAAAVTAGGERGTTGTYSVPVVIPDGHIGGVDFLNAAGGAILSSIDINPSLGENGDAKTSSRLATSGYTAPPSAATIAGAIWDEPTAGHTSTGSFGAFLNNLIVSIWGYGARTLTALGFPLGGAITVLNSVDAGGTVRLRVGAAYLASHGQALSWTDTISSTGWPDLSTATSVKFVCGTLVKTCVVDVASGTGKRVHVDLTGAETAALIHGTYEIQAFFSDATPAPTILARGMVLLTPAP